MDEIKKLRLKSLFGLVLLLVGLFTGYFYINHLIVGLLSIICMLSGWYIFSTYHTKISTIKIKKITQDYLSSMKDLKKK